MTLRRDTLRDPSPGPPAEEEKKAATTDPGPPPVLDVADDPGHLAAARNRSLNEPIEVIFQKIAQREQRVPRSIEPGQSYQAVHTPPPSRSTLLEAPVVLNITTDPDPRVVPPEESSVPDGVPGRSRRPALLALAVLAAVLLLALGVVMSRPSASTAGSAGPAAPSLRPSAAPMAASPSPSMVPAVPALPATAEPSLPPIAASAAPAPRPVPQRPAGPARPSNRRSETSDDPAGY
jgi:hypothetical protein